MSLLRQSFYYSAVESYISLFLQIIITMVISRLLTPAEAGTFALAAVFTSFAVYFRNFGITDYIIQEEELTPEKIRGALLINLIISWSTAAILWLAAPAIARFYGTPGIADILHLQSLGLVLMPFAGILLAYFRRNLDFRPVFVANVAANVTSFAVAIICALKGQGYMSLAWASFAGVVVNSAVIMVFKPADFPMRPSFKGFRQAFNFGKYASGVLIWGQLGKGAPEMIIGRAEDMASVAFFGRASGIIELFNKAILQAITPICLPYFASSHRELGTIKGTYLKTISYVTVIGWPFLTLLGLLAYAVIRIIYGPQWVASAPLAQILSFAFAIEVIHVFSKEALTSIGDIKHSNSLQIGVQVSRILGLLAVIPFGITEAGYGLVLAAIFNFFYTQWFLYRAFKLRISEVWEAWYRGLFISLAIAAPIYFITQIYGVNEDDYLWVAVFGSLLAFLIWAGLLLALRHPLLFELDTLLKRVPILNRLFLKENRPVAPGHAKRDKE